MGVMGMMGMMGMMGVIDMIDMIDMMLTYDRSYFPRLTGLFPVHLQAFFLVACPHGNNPGRENNFF
ncbi:MAG: hypothetical protein BGO30_07530 [Bacteroidetes bacterium 41-46]|nr:MAG: hypothetical protein BGO30_07530 [Bacteroidetes bacterium 41-46]